MKNNIILIGMPSSGKSTIGAKLAKKIKYDFIDTDTLITTKYGMPLTSIIDERGYDAFMEIEGETGATLKVEKSVIATGGSMVLMSNAMENLKSIGTIVFLDAPLNLLESRLEKTLHTRGVATPTPMTPAQILAYRLPYYQKYADITINCENNKNKTILEIIEALGLEV
ncbi:MAG: AAA family ATPase [Christensenellaceae bacterium]|nr:AAA family ATPase [Christensenellaceae bacterium]